MAGRRKRDLILEVRQIQDRRAGQVSPVGRTEIGALLKHETHRGDEPRDLEVAAAAVDGQRRRRRGLPGVDTAAVGYGYQLGSIGRGSYTAPAGIGHCVRCPRHPAVSGSVNLPTAGYCGQPRAISGGCDRGPVAHRGAVGNLDRAQV